VKIKACIVLAGVVAYVLLLLVIFLAIYSALRVSG
jgi:hypothetical protein